VSPPWRQRLEAALARRWWQREPAGWLWLLWPLAALYWALSAIRSALYRAGVLRPYRAPVPVVVVGNLIAGGAGKTPVVMALVRALQAQGWKPGVISRGHGRQGSQAQAVLVGSAAQAVGDEPLLIARHTLAPVWVGRSRARAAQALLQAHPEVTVLVADDGLQHLALGRNAQVIVFDERGVGNGQRLPFGPLREPLPRELPLRTQVIYNAPEPSMPWPGGLAQRQLAGAVPLADWWRGAPATLPALHALRGQPVLAAAGMAHPARFFDALRAHGLAIVPIALPDHHDFATLPWPSDTAHVLITEKDAVKIAPERAGATRVWVVPLDFSLPTAWVAKLLTLLKDAPDGQPPA
jgi:tetraacyldisaccharide 4'-kinase